MLNTCVFDNKHYSFSIKFQGLRNRERNLNKLYINDFI